MINIKDISGKILKSVIETADCKKYEELMSLCYISLSWDDENNIQLPAGSYIEYNGEKYRLLEPYDPSFKDESTFQYTPKFYDKIALWSKKPLFLVTDTGEETDWSMTAYPGQFMEAVVRALSKYTGETFTYSVDASIAQSTMEYMSFQNKNIFDGLTEIANKWDVEWWVEGNIIHLSKCQYGEPITLEVGKNVGIPAVTNNKDGYFTRFYAFGSTKNITQEYDDGGFTNGLVNKRLTLNPSLYPGGYMDIRPDLHPEEVFVKTLIFDNIFPSSKLVISGVRAELKDYIDSDGNKIQVGESEGKPLYKQYAIWHFKIDGFNFNNSTYDKDDNPEGMLLSGLDLSVIFESGQLNGRDFKLTYHEETQEYEINFVEESGSIIVPGTVSLIPADGDNIVLYNIRMPEEYVSSSQEELAEALLSEMERYKRNMNSYSFPSYPVSFYEENLDMKVGQSVSFVYGGNNLSTRVLKVEKQLDYPIEQTITIGEEKIKGNTQEIKEEVIDANQNIDVVKALADLNKAITDGYGRVQQLIMQSLSQYKGIWTLDQNDFPNDPSKWTIKTDYTAISAKDFIAFADGGEYASGLPVADFDTFGLFKAKKNGGLLFDVNEGWYVDPQYAGGGIDFTVGTGLDLSVASVLSVKFGTTAGTACQGNDSRLSDARRNPYALSWSGYSNGSYDGSSAKSLTIPSNTNQLTNGAGFIVDGNKNFTSLQGSGNSSQYLAGNGRFYTISHNEIDGLSSNYVTLNTQQIVTGLKTFRPGIRSGNPDTDLGIVTSSGNSINGMDKGVIGNLYLNYQGPNAFSKVDKNNNLITTGDIVAFADGGSYASGLPVADTNTYGLIKYDGTTIGKNSSGQLYVIGGSGGGSTIQVIDNLKSSSTTAALSANQGRLLDQRLQSVKFGSAYTDYVPVYLGSTSYNLSRYGHTHSQYLTSHQTIYSLKLIVNGTTYTYTPNSGSKTVTINTSGSSGATDELASTVYTPSSGTVFRYSGNNLGIKVSGGNSITGYDNTQSQSIGNLYLNYKSGSINVRISNEGKIYSNGSQVTSDLRLKTIVGHEEYVLDRMLRIPVIHYLRNDIPNSGLTTGFGAQHFLGVFDNVTFLNEDSGYYGINEGAILGIAFQGIKELYTRFLPVENKVKTLESRVQNLQLRLDNAYREIFELKQQKGGAA